MTILNKIIEATKERIVEAKKSKTIDELLEGILDNQDKLAAEIAENEKREEKVDIIVKEDFCFERALEGDDISFICEIKKASPSKGVIAENFNWLEIARDYEIAGANAISILTEPVFFQGDNRHLIDVANTVRIPILRKDFIIDGYQIYESKLLGADAILLIASILRPEEIKHFIKIADGLGLSCLVETHTEEEIISSLKAGARIIGVNNRDLKTFNVDINHTVRLRPFVPKDKLFVSESGISSSDHINKLKRIGANGVLIGEALMKKSDKKRALREFRG